jgi:HAD superfamily hydrolase (TIGR01549 family)
MPEPTIAVLDVDGTLVDSNYQHALAWYRALRSLDVIEPVWRLHRLIGMGGDQVIKTIGGDELEERIGEEARKRQGEHVDEMIGEVSPLPGARELLLAIKERGHRLVLASSGQPRHVDIAVDLLDARDIADAITSSEDAEATKPAPDLLQVALGKLGARAEDGAVMIGDSVWDVEAAKNAGLSTITVRSGGFGDEELREAGAIGIYDTPGDLAAALDETPLA